MSLLLYEPSSPGCVGFPPRLLAPASGVLTNSKYYAFNLKSVTSRPIQSPENTQALHLSNIRAELVLVGGA